MKKLLHKLLCLFGRHQLRTVVLHRPDGTEFLRGSFCDYCDHYELHEVDDEQDISFKETDPN